MTKMSPEDALEAEANVYAARLAIKQAKESLERGNVEAATEHLNDAADRVEQTTDALTADDE